jgi:hypothetical protein
MVPPPTLSIDFQIGVDNAMIQVPQNYTVPANPPSTPNPPTGPLVPTNTATATTKDSVTIYLSAIKGFHDTLAVSFFIQRIDTIVDPNLNPIDATTADWQGQIGSSPANWITGTYDSIENGWKGAPAFFTLTPSTDTTNPLHYYAAMNYQTLWINPLGTGGAIDPNHPPSYQVNIYALDNSDPLNPKYAACSFTLVVLPSVTNYGLGVYGKILSDPTKSPDPVTNPLVFANTVNLLPNGAGLTPPNFAVLYFTFYPLEPQSTAPTDVTITLGQPVNAFQPTDNVIDVANSTIYYNGVTYDFGIGGVNPVYTNQIVIPSGFSRNSPPLPVIITLYVAPAIPISGDSTTYHGLFKLIGTDANGVTTSAYTVIQVVNSL